MGDLKRRRNEVAEWKNVGELKVLYLVCLDDYELLKVTLDATYRFMESSEEEWRLFSDEMGEDWSEVVLDIKLGKGNGYSLWQAAKRDSADRTDRTASNKCPPVLVKKPLRDIYQGPMWHRS